MFSLSLRVTGHPCVFHHTRVRSSTQFYLSFNLPVTRSLGFGSTTCNSFALFRLGFPPAPALPSLNLAAYRNSQAHSTKGTLSPPYDGFNLLWVYGFRFSFTPLAGVLFAFPSRYLFTIGSCGVFSLGSWSTRIPTRFLVPRRTQVPHHGVFNMSCTGLSPCFAGFPKTVPLY